MKKLLFLLLFLPATSWSDSKLTALTADTTAQAGDLLYKVDSPGGTPTSRSITLTNLLSQVSVSSLTATGVTAGTYGSATQVSSVTLNAQGQVTGAANVTISLTNSNLQSGTYSNVTVPAANVAAGSLGGSVIASSIAVSAVQDASIVAVGGAKITGTGTIPDAAIDGSSVTKQGNTFNAANKLLQLDGSGLVPTTNLPTTVAYTTDDSTFSFTMTISSGSGFDSLIIPGPELDEVNNSTITLVEGETQIVSSTLTYALTYQANISAAGTNVFSVTYSTANDAKNRYSSFGSAIVPAGNSVAIRTPISSSAGTCTWVRITVWYKKKRN